MPKKRRQGRLVIRLAHEAELDVLGKFFFSTEVLDGGPPESFAQGDAV
jgi:hypothetical protein